MITRRHRMSGHLVAAVLLLAAPAHSAVMGVPRRITWRGTTTTADGLTGTFRVRTRFHDGRDMCPEYRGRFRCRGAGCPLPHGKIELLTNLAPDRIDEIIIGARFPVSLTCGYDNSMPPPDFRIAGQYACYTSGAGPGVLFAHGILDLVPSRISGPK